MEYRSLGRTGVQVSALCLGCMMFGGRTEPSDSFAIIDRALDAGINFLDTANVYGRGRSEEVTGEALQRNGKRHHVVLATKVHGRMDDDDPNASGNNRRHIIEQCEASLRRLGTDYIDLFYVHMWDPLTPIEETLRALDDLVTAGKVRYVGLSNFKVWQVMKALAISHENRWERFVTLEAMYSLASRWLEFELVPLCLDQGLGILAFSPLHGGFLSGKYRRGQPRPTGTRFDSPVNTEPWPIEPEILFDIVEELDKIAKEHGATISQTALNYLLRKPGVNSLIIGIRNGKQLEENLKATDWQMAQEEVAQLDKISEPVRRYPYYIYEPEEENPASA